MFILLDIDGVMVPAKSWAVPATLKDGFLEFSIKATNSLKRIISESGASIVLTTSHKSRYNDLEWNDLFISRGIHAEVSTFKSQKEFANRREEVLEWVNSSNCSSYVIIDDDKSLNDLPPDVKKRLVLTMPMIGLNENLAEEAIKIFKGDHMFRFSAVG